MGMLCCVGCVPLVASLWLGHSSRLAGPLPLQQLDFYFLGASSMAILGRSIAAASPWASSNPTSRRHSNRAPKGGAGATGRLIEISACAEASVPSRIRAVPQRGWCRQKANALKPNAVACFALSECLQAKDTVAPTATRRVQLGLGLRDCSDIWDAHVAVVCNLVSCASQIGSAVWRKRK